MKCDNFETTTSFQSNASIFAIVVYAHASFNKIFLKRVSLLAKYFLLENSQIDTVTRDNIYDKTGKS